MLKEKEKRGKERFGGRGGLGFGGGGRRLRVHERIDFKYTEYDR